MEAYDKLRFICLGEQMLEHISKFMLIHYISYVVESVHVVVVCVSYDIEFRIRKLSRNTFLQNSLGTAILSKRSNNLP